VAFDLETILMLALNNILLGMSIAVGFWIASLVFLRSIKRQMPIWIHQLKSEISTIQTMNRVIEIRNKYK
jgi:hypothetical protein